MIVFSLHARKRGLENNIDLNSIKNIIYNTKQYDDLSQTDSNRVIYVGKIGKKYWTFPCEVYPGAIVVVTIRESYTDEIKMCKKDREMKR